MRPWSGSDDRRMAWRSDSEGLIARAQRNSGALGVGSLEHGCAKSDVTSATLSEGSAYVPVEICVI